MVFGVEVAIGFLVGVAVVIGALMLAIRPELRHPKRKSWMAPPSGDVDDYRFGGMGPNE